MLIINGHRESCIPITHTGGVVYSDIQPNWYRSENWMRIFLGEGGFTKQTSIPDGNYHPVAWYWPMTAGNISSRNKLTGAGAISAADGDLIFYMIAALSGSGTVPGVTLAGFGAAIAALTGNGTITAAALLGSGALLADLVASGEITDADIKAFLQGSAGLTGEGGITDAGGIALGPIVAALTGSGTITNADLKAYLDAVAALSGSGTITDAELLGLGALLAALTGTATMVGTLLGSGELTADIKAYGDLTPEGIRDAIWNAILENYLSSGSTGQALNAAGAAGDPWTTTLPGAYTGDQAGNIIGKKLLTLAKFLGMK